MASSYGFANKNYAAPASNRIAISSHLDQVLWLRDIIW